MQALPAPFLLPYDADWPLRHLRLLRVLSRHFYHIICLNHIIYLNIIEFLKYQSTFITSSYFFYIIFKSL